MKRHTITLSVSLPDNVEPTSYLDALKSIILIGAKRVTLSHNWTGETRHMFTIHTAFLPLHYKTLFDESIKLAPGEMLACTRDTCIVKSAEAARHLIQTVWESRLQDKSDECEMERFYLAKVMAEINKVSPPV